MTENPPIQADCACPVVTSSRITVLVDHTPLDALVDTGAAVSCIRRDVAEQLRKVILPWSGRLLFSANGSPLQPCGQSTARITLDDETTSWELCVLPALPCSLIIGWDLLSSTRVTIHCTPTDDLPLLDASSEDCDGRVATVSEDVRLPPKTAVAVELSVSSTSAHDAILDPKLDVLLPRQLLCQRALLGPDCHRVCVLVLNVSDSPQYLPKGMKVANVSPVDPLAEPVCTVQSTPHSPVDLTAMIDPVLPHDQRDSLLELLRTHSSIFAADSSQVGRTSVLKHTIDTGDHRPVRQMPYRVSYKERRAISDQVQDMLRDDVIQPSSSPWSSPVVLVKKKDGSFRFCVDYRRLNRLTKRDVYPLPRVDDTLDRLQDASYFSSIDLASGYWQVEVDERDREKTAFITPDGLYEFKVMPFGLCNAPSTFQRMIDLVLAGLKWSSCLVYLDDVIVFSRSFEEHLGRLDAVLAAIEDAGLTLRPSKCRFGSKRLLFLGHVVDSEGVSPDPAKISAVSEFPTPRTLKQLRSFLGLCSYYRRFVKDFSRIAHPLTQLTKKDHSFEWTAECETAFRTLQRALTTAPVLAHFNDTAPTSLHTDASNYGLGAVLVQNQGGRERVIAYASRTLNPAERNYSVTERECLAVVWAITKFRPYIFGRPFTVVTDHHALCWLASLRDPSGRLARWALRLQEFDVTIVHKSGRKHQDADCLSRAPVSDPIADDDDESFLFAITSTLIAEAQRNDPGIQRIIRRADDDPDEFRLEDDVWYRRNHRPLGRPWLLLLPRELFPAVLAQFHDDPTAGHLGLHRTWERVRQRFYAPKLFDFVRRYVASCRDCQRRKKPPLRPAGLLQPIPSASFPFQRLGRFPPSHHGNRWIIVCTDYFTRYAETKAIPAGTAEEIAEFLLTTIILRHGAPSELLSDRGQSFLSHVVRSLTESFGIARRLTTAYHPQTNGLTERFNRTLADMISMYVDDEHRNWDEILPFVTFAYNTSRQETTGFSPFYLLHGREANTTLDATLPALNADMTPEEYAESLRASVDDAYDLVQDRTSDSQRRSKETYDEVHRAAQFHPGDLVWLWVPVRRVGRSEKLLHRYFGPYRVLRRTSPVNYELEAADEDQPERGRRRRAPQKEIVHVSRLKPYIGRHPDDSYVPSEDTDADSTDAHLLSDDHPPVPDLTPSSRLPDDDDIDDYPIAVMPPVLQSPAANPSPQPQGPSREPARPRSPYLLRSRVRL